MGYIVFVFSVNMFVLCKFFWANIFVALFSGTVRSIKLKVGTRVDNGSVYREYQNQDVGAYSSLYFFIFRALQFSNMYYKFSSHFAQELRGLQTWK